MVEQTKIRTGIQFERGSTTIFMTLFLTFVVVGGIQIYTQFYAPMEQNARLAAADGSSTTDAAISIRHRARALRSVRCLALLYGLVD